MTDIASVLGRCHEFEKARKIMEGLPGSTDTFFGDKDKAMRSLAISACQAGKYSLSERCAKALIRPDRRDRTMLTLCEMFLSKGKQKEALKITGNIKSDATWIESSFVIALAAARNGDPKRAKELLRRDDRAGDACKSMLSLFKLEDPRTWVGSGFLNIEAQNGGRAAQVACAAIPLWYELQAGGKLTKSPVESMDLEKVYSFNPGLFRPLARADARAGDPNTVLRWVSGLCEKKWFGNPLRKAALMSIVATEAARRLEKPNADRDKDSSEVSGPK